MTSPEYIIQQVKSKLNKLDSKDYDNLPSVQILTSYNEERLNWLRRNLVGTNNTKSGDESTIRRLDDFNQILVPSLDLVYSKKKDFYLTQKLPENYFAFKRLDLKASSECCTGTLPMIAYLDGEADVNLNLRSTEKRPDFDFGETICSLVDNRLKIYTNDEFDIESAKLVYYRFPKTVTLSGVFDLESDQIASATQGCEFKKDLGLLFIAQTVSALANNLEILNVSQIQSNNTELNN